MFRLVHAGVYLCTNSTYSWKSHIPVNLHYIVEKGISFLYMFKLIHAGVYLCINLTSSWKPNIPVDLQYIVHEGVVFTSIFRLLHAGTYICTNLTSSENRISQLIYILLFMKELSLHLCLGLCMQVYIFIQT